MRRWRTSILWRLIALLGFVWKVRHATTVMVFAYPINGEMQCLQFMPRQADYGASKRYEEWFRTMIKYFVTNKLAGDTDTRVFRV